MKIRTDFVTNSSSSSFVLAFKDVDEDGKRYSSYDYFKDVCCELDYEEFYNLINRLKNDSESTDKEKALEFLKRYYQHIYEDSMVEAEIDFLILEANQNNKGIQDNQDSQNDQNNQSTTNQGLSKFYDRYEIRCNIRNASDYQTKIDRYLECDREYQKKKKQIQDADLVVQGIIWDTNGGVLEWAIRNGFIEDNFSRNSVVVWNVG